MLNESLTCGGLRGPFVRLWCLLMKRRGWALRSRALACKTAGGKIIGAGQAGLDTRVSVALLSMALAFALPGAAAAEDGVTADRILFGQSAALSGPAAELGIEMRRGIARRLRRGQRRRRHRRPASRSCLPRRPLRAGGSDRQHPGPDREGQGLCADRRGRHTDLGGGRADRARRRRAVHRAFHRGRVPARPGADQRRQRPRLLFRGDRDDRRAAGHGRGAPAASRSSTRTIPMAEAASPG